MNSKNLIISFVTVSIAALIVSSFTVFTVARRYASELSARESEEIAPPPDTSRIPDESISLPTVNSHPESEAASAEAAASETSHETAPVTAETTDEITEKEEAASSPAEFMLTLSDDRLVILSPEGETVYERIINVSELHKKDRENLIRGISFPDTEAAMSAVYDLIS